MMKERVSFFVVCEKGSVSSWTRKKRMVKRDEQNVVPVWGCCCCCFFVCCCCYFA